MRKLISSINIILDGFCDHTAVIAGDELHENANELFKGADILLFGRKTYQLMENGWPPKQQIPKLRQCLTLCATGRQPPIKHEGKII